MTVTNNNGDGIQIKYTGFITIPIVIPGTTA